MDRFLQVTAGVLLAAILVLILNKQNQELSLALTAIVCCMVLLVIAMFLEPVLDFVHRLRELGKLDSQLMQVLLKAVGVGLIGEFASKLCGDSGNSALGKAIQMVATAVILWISLPLMQSLLDMVESILGEV